MAISQDNSSGALRTLRVRWLGFVALGTATLIGGYMALDRLWGQQPARNWLPLAALVFIYQVRFLRSKLAINRRGAQGRVPTLQPPG